MREGGHVFEKRLRDGDILLYSRHREISETALKGKSNHAGERDLNIAGIFSTEAESPFENFTPRLEQTKIFLARFFMRRSFKDMAVMFDTKEETLRSQYTEAVRKLKRAIKLIDDRQKYIFRVRTYLDNSSRHTGRLSNGQRWLLLSKVFGLTPVEIGKIDDVQPKTVRTAIKRTYDRVITGREIFLNPTRDKIKEAQARLDAKRARDRAYAKKNKIKKSEYDKLRYQKSKAA